MCIGARNDRMLVLQQNEREGCEILALRRYCVRRVNYVATSAMMLELEISVLLSFKSLAMVSVNYLELDVRTASLKGRYILVVEMRTYDVLA